MYTFTYDPEYAAATAATTAPMETVHAPVVPLLNFPTFPVFYEHIPFSELPPIDVSWYTGATGTAIGQAGPLTPPPSDDGESIIFIESPHFDYEAAYPTPAPTPPIDTLDKLAQLLNPKFEPMETDDEFLEQCRIHQLMEDEVSTYD